MARYDDTRRKGHVYKMVDSPVGRLTLVASDQGLAAILWENDRPRRVRLNLQAEDAAHPVLVETERQLGEYFAGQRKAFALTLDVDRHAVSEEGVERAADDSVRRDAVLRRDRATGRQPRCGARGRRGERPESGLDRRPVPPGDRGDRES